MRPDARLKLIFLTGFVALLAACQLTSTPTTTANEPHRQIVPQVESPLSAVDRLDSISAYHVTLHSEAHLTLPDGSTGGGTTEYNAYWTQSTGPNGYNAHYVTTMIDPQSGTPSVMDESYLVDDLAFTYCPMCPATAEQGGWGVSKREESAAAATELDVANVSRRAGIPLAELVAKSVVIGEETINGIVATHYLGTDAQVLLGLVRTRMGGSPSTPLKVTMAQADIWLTAGDQQPIQYTFQAEGKTETVAGSQSLQPFTLQEQYSVTEINNKITITVPADVLTAVTP